MIKVVKKEIDVEESLKKRLEIICDFCNTEPKIINGIIRKLEKEMVIMYDEVKKDDFYLEIRYKRIRSMV